MCKKPFLPLLLFLLISISLAHASARKNWIAFNGTGGVFKYIMAIDEDGNILVPPKAVLSYNKADFANFPGQNCVGEPINPYGRGPGDNVNCCTNGGASVAGPLGPLDGPCAIALSNNGGSINYYILTSQGSIFKFDLPKSTLTPTTALPKVILGRTAETKIRDFRTLQATQNVPNQFLAMIFGKIGIDTCCSNKSLDSIVGSLTTFGLNADGTVKKKGKNISPNISGLAKIGSISADGLMSVANQEIGGGNFDDNNDCSPKDNDAAGDIFATPVTASGTAAGPAVDIGTTKPQTGAVDVSNEVSAGVRFVVYATRSSDTPDSTNGDDLILQKIDAHTGAKIGGRHFLQQDIEMDMTFFQGVAVDPEGEFVVFTKRPVNSKPGDGGECVGVNSGTNFDGLQTGNRDSLFFIPINIATGEAAGSPKLLFSADDGPATGQDDEDGGTSCGGPNYQEFAIPQINGIDVLVDE